MYVLCQRGKNYKNILNFMRMMKAVRKKKTNAYPKNPETPIQKNLCTPVFIETQFTIGKSWKLKCPLVNK